MSIIIFFGMATFIFLLGLLVVGVTLFRWKTEGIPQSQWAKKTRNSTPNEQTSPKKPAKQHLKPKSTPAQSPL